MAQVFDQYSEPGGIRVERNAHAEVAGPGDLHGPLSGRVAGKQDFTERRRGRCRRSGAKHGVRGPTGTVNPIMELRRGEGRVVRQSTLARGLLPGTDAPTLPNPPPKPLPSDVR